MWGMGCQGSGGVQILPLFKILQTILVHDDSSKSVFRNLLDMVDSNILRWYSGSTMSAILGF